MGFGQSTGPPASAKQMRELLALLHEAGHTDFRDARGPMGFTQRQAGGKFTGEEAAAFIDELENPTEIEEDAPESGPLHGPDPAELAVRRMPAEKLAAELQRRGWAVTPPSTSPR